MELLGAKRYSITGSIRYQRNGHDGNRTICTTSHQPERSGRYPTSSDRITTSSIPLGCAKSAPI